MSACEKERTRSRLDRETAYTAIDTPPMLVKPLRTDVDARKMLPMSGFLRESDGSRPDGARTWSMSGDEEGDGVGESENARSWWASTGLENQEIVSRSSSVRLDMGEEVNLLSVLEFESSEGACVMGGVAWGSGESVTLAARINRVAAKSTRESRGVAMGVRRGDVRCSSSSLIGGERVRGTGSGRNLLLVG